MDNTIETNVSYEPLWAFLKDRNMKIQKDYRDLRNMAKGNDKP